MNHPVRPWKGKSFNKWLVEEYFKHGSVDEVMKFYRLDIPISYAQYQRVLDKWGVVKKAGPNSRLSEVVGFLSRMIEEEIPLDKLYKRMPPSFKTSAVTLYRIASYIKEGVTRRIGTGLIVVPYNNDRKVLVAEDISTPRLSLGKKYGSISLPMGFSRMGDRRKDAVLRIMQNEVFTQQAIENKIPKVIPESVKPFLYLDIADVRVEMFVIKLPKRLSKTSVFSSFKMTNFRFINIDKLDQIKNKDYRVGVIEAVEGYKKYLRLKDKNIALNPMQIKSRINYQINPSVEK